MMSSRSSPDARDPRSKAPATAARVLTKHFQRGLLENDVISPHGDRRDGVVIVIAALFTSTLFLTVLLCTKYLFGIQLVGPTMLAAMDDRLLYISISMIVMALVAVVTWSSLSLDERDSAILGVLPIPHWTMAGAKMRSVLTMVMATAVALNAVPTFLYSTLLILKLPVGPSGWVTLVGVHAAVTLGAGLFGFLVVLMLRELLHVVLGERAARRAANPVQAALVVGLLSTFLLLPSLASRTSRTWLTEPPVAPAKVAPLWFLGAYEAAAGKVLLELPPMNVPPRLVGADRRALAAYRTHQPQLMRLGYIAVVVFPIAVLIAFAAYGWNMRQLPGRYVERRSDTSVRRVFTTLAKRCIATHPVSQAAFFFTLQTLARSASHRLWMAGSSAIGLAIVLALVSGTDLDPSAAPSARVLAVQIALVVVLVATFRFLVKLPAELRANWLFEVAWGGYEYRFMQGVRRAAVLAFVVVPVAALFPMYLAAVELRVAVLHSGLGIICGSSFLQLALLSFRRVPFTCSYVPVESLKAWAPIYVIGGAAVIWVLVVIERLAIPSQSGASALIASAIVVASMVDLVDRRRRKLTVAMRFDDIPDPPTLRLGLTG